MRIYGTEELLDLFECTDVDALRVKLRAEGIDYSYNDITRYICTNEVNLPEALVPIARERYPSDGDLRQAREKEHRRAKRLAEKGQPPPARTMAEEIARIEEMRHLVRTAPKE